MTTRAIPSRDPKRPDDDLRVIRGGDGHIILDQRNRQPSNSSKITFPSQSQQQKPSAVPKPLSFKNRPIVTGLKKLIDKERARQ